MDGVVAELPVPPFELDTGGVKRYFDGAVLAQSRGRGWVAGALP